MSVRDGCEEYRHAKLCLNIATYVYMFTYVCIVAVFHCGFWLNPFLQWYFWNCMRITTKILSDYILVFCYYNWNIWEEPTYKGKVLFSLMIVESHNLGLDVFHQEPLWNYLDSNPSLVLIPFPKVCTIGGSRWKQQGLVSPSPMKETQSELLMPGFDLAQAQILILEVEWKEIIGWSNDLCSPEGNST